MKRILRLAFFVGFAFFLTNTLKAQVSAAVFSQTTGTYSEITGGTQVFIATANATTDPGLGDDQNFAVTIPFTFTINGTGYTACTINTNGHITFGTAGATNVYSPISNTGAYSACVSALGRDLSANTNSANLGEIRVETLGTAPNQTFVIQWKKYRRFSSSNSFTENLNFQIRLAETTNVASVVYGACVSTSTSTAITVQVGLRGSVNTDFNNRTTTTNWSSTTAGTLNTSSCRFTTTVSPASGLTFIWTPASGCTGTPAPGNAIASINPVACPGGTTVLSLQNATPGSGVTYQWESSPDNAVYTNITGATSATYTATLSTATWFRCNVTCMSNTGTSNPLQVTLTTPNPAAPYCIGTFSSGCGSSDVITNVTTGPLNNASGCSPNTCNLYYTNYTTGPPVPDLTKGQSQSISVTVGAGGTEYVRIFIDFNQDFDFLDAGENVLLGSGNGVTITGSVPIPVGATSGNTRMRVRLTYNTSTFTECSAQTFGETEDYTVNVVEPASIDMGATALATPATSGCYGPAELVTVTIKNYSTQTIDFAVNNCTVTCDVTGAATQTFTEILSSGTLAANATMDVVMSGSLDMTATGTYTFNANTAVTGDGNNGNNAMAATNRTTTAPAAVPYSANFDPAPSGWTTTGWTIGAGGHGNPNNGLYKNLWSSAPSGTFTMTKVGPLAGDEYLIFDYRLVNYTSYPAVALPNTPAWGSIVINISTDCGATFTTFQTINNTNHVSTTAWATKNYSLAAYAGQQVIFRYNCTWLAGDYYADFDNFKIEPGCSGTPTAGTPSPVALFLCPGGTGVITVTGASTGAGISYQWEESNDDGAGDPWANAVGGSGATTVVYTTAPYVNPIYYRLKVTCANGPTEAFTVSVPVTPPAPPACVALLLPADNAVDQLQQPLIDWASDPNAGTYELWMTPSAGGGTDCASAGTPVLLTTVTAPTSQYTLTAGQALALGKFYRWYIVPKDCAGTATPGCDATPFCFKTVGPPDNDQCSGAIVIPNGSLPVLSAITANITYATTTGDPALPSCQSSVSRSVWYTFTPLATSCYTIATCIEAPYNTGTTVSDNVMAVYTSTGGCAGPFTQVSGGCDDDGCNTGALMAVITNLPMTAGITYYIVVHKYGTTAPTAGQTAQQVHVSEGASMSITSSTTVQSSTAVVLPSSTNQQIIRAEVVAAGCANPISVNSIDFGTGTTQNPTLNLTAARCYFTGTSATFSTTTPFGSEVLLPNGAFTMSGSQALSIGTNYFWLVYDIACSPNDGDMVDAVCSSIALSSGGPLTPTVTDPAGVRLVSTAGQVYTSIADGFFSDPATWICGAVPPSGTTNAIVINHNVQLDQTFNLLNTLTINAAKTFTMNTGNNFTTNALTLNGVLQLSAGFMNVISTGMTMGSTAVLNLDGGHVNISVGNFATATTGTPTLNLNQGTFTLGPSGGGNRTFSTYGPLIIQEATVNINGSVILQLPSSFTMSGGNLNMDPNDGTLAGSAATATFLTLTPTYNLTGGYINLIDPPYTSGFYTLSYSHGSVDAVWGIGNTVTVGGGAHTNPANLSGFLIECNAGTGTLEIGNLVLNGGMYADQRHTATNPNTLYITKVRNLVVNSGAEVVIQSSPLVITGAELLNEGLITAAGTIDRGLVFAADAQYTGSTVLTNTTIAQAITGTGYFRKSLATPIPANQDQNTLATLSLWNTGAAGVTLNMPMSVDALHIQGNGHINTSQFNYLVIGTSSTFDNTGTILQGTVYNNVVSPSGTVASASTGIADYTGGWINGPLRRWFLASTNTGQTGLLPVGTAAKAQLASVLFTGAPTTAGTLSSSFSNSIPAGYLGLNLTQAGIANPIVAVSPSGSWDISQTDGMTGGTYTTNLYANSFLKVDNTTAIPGGFYNELTMVKRESGESLPSDWELIGSHTATPLTAPIAKLERTGMTGFSQFGVAGTAAALPLELKSFTGKIVGEFNRLDWATASELNVNQFFIERSTDGATGWKSIGSTPSKGNTNTGFEYSLDDRQPLPVSYYRLRSVDFDGKEQVSGIVVLVRETRSFGIATAFPVPSLDEVSIQYETLEESSIALRVTDLAGRLVQIENCSAAKGLNTCTTSLARLEAGVYLVVIDNGTTVSAPVRVVKQ